MSSKHDQKVKGHKSAEERVSENIADNHQTTITERSQLLVSK